MSGRNSDSLNANTNNEPDMIYYNLVESYISSTREMLNGFMTFERGLVRILNNRIIFRNLPPAPAPVPAPAPAPVPVAELLPQTQPVTATFVRYRLPLPSVTSRAARGISTTPNLSASLTSSPPHSPPPPPPPQTQSISPIFPIGSRINRSYDWLNFVETTNINNQQLNRDETTNTNYFQRLLQRQIRPPLPLQQRPPLQEHRAPPFMQREEQRAPQEQPPPHENEGDPNYVSYDTIQIATKLIPFCTIDNPQNEICPISQIQFKEIDCIMQINHCKHNFNPYSLFRWLDSSSTCPMCRYNLNSYSNDQDGHNDGDEIRIVNHYHRSEMASESESEYD